MIAQIYDGGYLIGTMRASSWAALNRIVAAGYVIIITWIN